MLGRNRPPKAHFQGQEPLALAQCLAKSYKPDQGNILKGCSVAEHCHIVGAVARALIQRLPGWLQDSLFPAGSDLIAAAHDLGKVSPTFQKKIYSALTENDTAVLAALSAFNPETEKLWGGHAGISQAAAKSLNVGTLPSSGGSKP